MKFTLSWLKEHLDTTASVDEIAETLTRIGLEVEEVLNPAAKLAGFVTAKVEECEMHPDSDHLHQLKVNTACCARKRNCASAKITTALFRCRPIPRSAGRRRM